MAGKRPIVTPSTLLPGGISAAAPAKVNRFLHVTGRRQNGYHDLETGFQFLDWHDIIHIRQCSAPGVHLIDDPMNLGETNLVVRGANLLLGHKEIGCEICIEKNLPSGAGIGGGSSDCATTLALVNHFFNLKYSESALLEIGLKLGADVPVFLHGTSCFASGIGELFEFESWPGSIILIANPKVSVSTKEIFQHPRLARNTPSRRVYGLNLDDASNDFESLVRELYPSIDDLFAKMALFGKPQLTGTGGCVFVVDPILDAINVDNILEDCSDVYQGYLCEYSMLYNQ